MIIIPAIDIKDGKCVRLRQGRMDSSTVFNEDPAAQARQWEDLGAPRIHVVDLDGSVEGRPVNQGRIRQIVESVRVPVQIGGGVRDEDTIRAYLDAGVITVIIGTLAAKAPGKVLGFIETYPGKIAIGIDARGGMVAVEGWTEATSLKASELAARFSAAGPTHYIYTDIDRDGMMLGPNVGATREFAASTAIPVILSGGVTSITDVRDALALEKDGVTGIIIGRALYEGAIDLKEAIGLTGGGDAR